MYYAVIGEMLFSEKPDNQEKIREDLMRTLEYINTYYKEDIASDLVPTEEGKFCGFFYTGRHVLEILDIIQFRFRKIPIRFGVGIGEMLQLFCSLEKMLQDRLMNMQRKRLADCSMRMTIKYQGYL